ncbi:hypothetical protein K9M78_00985 [Candidatus Bipolaricaulota bacterium]|nr:hypothetical protein [Candidatus Bipolaricaulota bacterium]
MIKIKYLFAGLAEIVEMGIWGAVIAPFAIWGLGEILWVGLFFPLVKALKDISEKRERARIECKHALILGCRRVKSYKWEIFFASVGGVLILDIYWMFINLADDFLPSFLYVLILFISTFLLCILLFSKGNGIMSSSPAPTLRSMKFIWGGFMNPFDETKVSKMRDVVIEVNENIMESSSSCRFGRC